jgi:plastocyanin
MEMMMRRTTHKLLSIPAFALASTMLACGGGGGGSSNTPTSPTPSPTPGGSGNSGGTTITIQSGGVMNPPMLTVSPGTRVTFINNDSRSRQIESDPHPTHEDCPEIGQVGFIQPGQTKLTGNLNTIRTCGYHDHNDPGIRGDIRIQSQQQSQ